MEQSSASENTKKEVEIEPCQNEELMDDIHVTKTSIENLSLEIEASKAFESNDEMFILNYRNYILKGCFGSLNREMPFVGLSMWSMIIN